MTPSKRRPTTLVALVLAPALVVASAALAFACSTFVGKLTIKGNAGTGTSVAQGNNNCDVGGGSGCGMSNGSMRWCSTFTVGARAHATSGTVNVQMADTDVCNVQYGHGESHLTPNAVYDINYRAGDLMSSTDTTVVDAQDCMAWYVGNGTVRLATALADANGAFNKTVSLPSPTTVNAVGRYATICVNDTPALFGNLALLQIVT